MSFLVEKTQNKIDFWVKTYKKCMKNLDLRKYKKKMSCSVEKTQNKIDFWG